MTSENYFELFGLPERYILDETALEQNWRRLAAQVHPDRFATATPAERRIAMQWASTVNEAYRVLKSPLNRASYLCERAGCDLQAESNTRMDPDFLMRQMDWRERLDDAGSARDVSALGMLSEEIAQAQAELTASVTALIDAQRDYDSAAQRVREWLFIEKLQQELKASRNDIFDRQI